MDRNLAQVSKFRKIALYSVLGLLAASVFRLLLGLLPEPPGIVFGLVITLLLFGFLVTVIISLVPYDIIPTDLYIFNSFTKQFWLKIFCLIETIDFCDHTKSN